MVVTVCVVSVRLPERIIGAVWFGKTRPNGTALGPSFIQAAQGVVVLKHIVRFRLAPQNDVRALHQYALSSRIPSSFLKVLGQCTSYKCSPISPCAYIFINNTTITPLPQVGCVCAHCTLEPQHQSREPCNHAGARSAVEAFGMRVLRFNGCSDSMWPAAACHRWLEPIF